MSLLGIDIGTTGCKSIVFSIKGEQLARSYLDYEIISNSAGYAELDPFEIWEKVKLTIIDVASQTSDDPIKALSVSSLGEAMVPVSKDGKILGNSILGSDLRGSEFINILQQQIDPYNIFRITGNLPDTFYSLSKILWIKKYQSDLFLNTSYSLTWSDFIAFKLGGKATTNFTLADRSLLFDINSCKWSDEIFNVTGLDKSKFAPPVPSGSFLGYVRDDLAKKLHLGAKVAIISGGHDQCCAILGSGIKRGSNTAIYAIGTYLCIATVFSSMPDINSMFKNKLHIQHHVIPGSFVTLFYRKIR